MARIRPPTTPESHPVGEVGGGGPGTDRVGEDVKVGETDPSAEGQGLLKVLLRLARKPDDHVSGNGRVGKGSTDALHRGQILRCSVAAPHSGQDAIVSALQGHVEMRTQSPVILPEAEEVAGYLLGLERGDTEARDLHGL